MFAFNEVLKARCQEHDKPYAVTPPQWGVLSLLIEHDGLTIGATRAFNEIMMRGFSENQQRDLIAKLQQIVINLGEIGPDTGDRFGLLPQFFQKT